MADGVQDDLDKIGAALRDARLQALLSQSEVGQRAGVSRQLVSRIEQGLNGEITAYAAVAAALEYRLAVAATGKEPTGLEFTLDLSPELSSPSDRLLADSPPPRNEST